MKKKILRIGMIGTGRIAARFVDEIKYVEQKYQIGLQFVYNPHPQSAAYLLISIISGMQLMIWLHLSMGWMLYILLHRMKPMVIISEKCWKMVSMFYAKNQ